MAYSTGKRKRSLTRGQLRDICSDLWLPINGDISDLTGKILERNAKYSTYMQLDEESYTCWQQMCETTFTQLQCCPICAHVQPTMGDSVCGYKFKGLGKLPCEIWEILDRAYDTWIQYMPHKDWIYCNKRGKSQPKQVNLRSYLQGDQEDSDWSIQICSACYEHRDNLEILNKRANLPFHHGTVACGEQDVPYVHLYYPILSEHPFHRSYFSLLDITYDIEQLTSGCTLRPRAHRFFEMPLFANRLSDTDDLEQARLHNHGNVKIFEALSMYNTVPPFSIQSLYVTNMQNNKLFQDFVPLLERKDIDGNALYVGPADSDMLKSIIQPSKIRNVSTSKDNIDSSVVLGNHEVVAVLCGRPHTLDGIHDDETVHVGTLETREGSRKRAVMTTLNNKNIDLDPQCCPTDDATTPLGVIEQLLHPHLFPQMDTYWIPNVFGGVGINSFKKYVSHRCHQLFSPFSMTQEYLCNIYQMMKTIDYGSTNEKVIIQREYNRERKKSIREKKPFDVNKCINNIHKYKIPKVTKGSPLYYRNKLYDVQAMSTKYGLPHLMMTLTADDCSLTRWKEYDALDGILEKLNPNLTFKSTPCETTLLFHHRFEKFFNHFILGAGRRGVGLLKRVKHYVIKYELQGRQAWHAHVLLWIEKEDLPEVEKLLTMEIPYDVDPRTGDYTRPANSILGTLHDIVVMKNQHQCRPGECMVKGKCKYGFPFPNQFSHSPVMDDENTRYLPYCPGEKHRNTVCYVPMIALLWNAHTNVVRVTNEIISKYLLKYVVKMEPAGSLDVTVDCLKSLGITESSDIVMRLLSQVIYSKPVSASEAVLEMLGIEPVRLSDDVLFINTTIPSQRKAREATVRRAGGEAFDLDAISTYCYRPVELEDLTLVQFYEMYEVKPRSTKATTTKVRCAGTVNNKNIVKRKQDTIVRLSRYSPTSEEPEGFFFNVLLQNVPFRRENELLGADHTYYQKCKDINLCDTEESLRHIIQQHHVRVFTTSFNLDMDCEFVDRHYQQRVDMELHVPEYQIPALDFSLDDMQIMLTADQLNAYNDLIQNPHGFHVIQGGPGSGKSFLISLLHRYFHAKSKNVVLCASTAVAATNIRGCTIDRVVGLDENTRNNTNININKKAYQFCRLADVFIIDEAFMLDAQKLDVCLKRALNCGNTSAQDQINSKLFILVGDRNQLPPVCTHKQKEEGNAFIQTCTKCNILNSEFRKYTWQFHTLTNSQRYKDDPMWASFISTLVNSNDLPTQEEIQGIFQDRILPESEWLPFLLDNDDAISIHPTNKSALELGEKVLMHKCAQLGKPVFDLSPTFRLLCGEQPNTALTEKVERHFSSAKSRIHCLTKVCIGSEVIFARNQNFDEGIINGARGFVVSVAYKKKYSTSRLSKDAYVKTPNLDSDMIPWALKVRVTSTNKVRTLYAHEVTKYLPDGTLYAIRYFPILSATSFTAHKSQGRTIASKTLVDIRDLFQDGQLFVMITRMTSLQNLFLTGMPTPEMFRIHPIVDE